MDDNLYFYRDLPALDPFSEAIQPRMHTPVPEDWWIVIADVVDSTKAIEAGDYKKVNTVGVACIASILNIDRDVEIPFVFGGDGATFAIPDGLKQGAIPALRGTQKLSHEQFNLDLRVGLIRVGDIVKEGLQVNLAKVRLSPHATQATFSGGGWSEAEIRVKGSDRSKVETVRSNEGPAEANFEGFECRWRGVPNFNGHKLALLVEAKHEDPAVNRETYRSVIDKINSIYGDMENCHPLRPARMRLTLSPKLLVHEWRVRAGGSGFWKRVSYFIGMVLKNLYGMYFFARNLDSATTKWSHYRTELVENTDFRKFDGILRILIDSGDAQTAELEAFLGSEYKVGRLAFGTHKSREALVTCLVRSYTGNHMHFVDGSDGGYAMAAIGLKRQLGVLKPATRR